MGCGINVLYGSAICLPRLTRCVLSQLRSGHCARLNTFKFTIGSSITVLCPDCDAVVHDTGHLFECPANPTSLTVRNLWHRPYKPQVNNNNNNRYTRNCSFKGFLGVTQQEAEYDRLSVPDRS